MASSKTPAISDFKEDEPARPKIGLFSMIRLGLFNTGIAMMSLLTLGVLNRIMIDELKVPALVTAGAIAMYQFVSPARIWFGQLSDVKPLLGHYRSGYIWLGTAGMGLMAFIAVQVMWQLGEQMSETGWGPSAYPWAGLLAFVFAIYGLALAATTPFTALLVDVSDEKTKSKIVGVGWSMLMFGIIAGVALINALLGPENSELSLAALRGPINRVFIVVPLTVLAISFLSTVGVEKRFSRRGARSTAQEREDGITLRQALKVLTASRQTGLFFCFLLVLSLSLFTQNPVLEPYGSQIFGMSLRETNMLNAFFGVGTLVGILSTGFVLMPLLGKKTTVKVGCTAAAVFLVGLAAVGITANPMALNLAVGCFGLASGVLTTGSIVLMLDLTASETAGTFIGAWGLAQAMAQGGASLLGGALLTLGKILTGASAVEAIQEVPAVGQLLPAYGLVFVVQAVGMLVAIALVSRVNIQSFQMDAKRAIAAALENDL
ncbi:MAG: BCD family MFS transporter [Cyanobacteria bacterium P01_F01_bin.3]